MYDEICYFGEFDNVIADYETVISRYKHVFQYEEHFFDCVTCHSWIRRHAILHDEKDYVGL